MVLYEKIQNDPLEFPPEVNMSPGLRRLLMAMMEKGPAKRIALDQVKERHKERSSRVPLFASSPALPPASTRLKFSPCMCGTAGPWR